ncbi:MAG: hypothetical protein AB1705_25110 [Verrucomicrobiota bacterium]
MSTSVLDDILAELGPKAGLERAFGPDFVVLVPDARQKLKAFEEMQLDTHRTVSTFARRREFKNLVGQKAAAKVFTRLPSGDETIHALLGGDFNAWDLVPVLVSLAGAVCDELIIATLGFNSSNNAELCEMLDAGRIRSVWFLASEYCAKSDADLFENAQRELRRRGQKIAAARNHAKIQAFRFASTCIVVEGSANLRSCNNIEQLTITNSPELFEFHRAWITQVINQRSDVPC